MKVRVSSSFVALSIACAVGASGCGNDTAESKASGVPVIDVALNRGYQTNKGLVTMLDNRGWPLRDGDSMDPTIVEARKFYDTLKSPSEALVMVDYPDPFTNEAAAPKRTAPLTFDAWKTTFNIPARLPGESLPDYRKRADVVVYYNKNELGLGRELGCATFDDGTATDGTKLTGVACYVTNYGTAFRDLVNSLPLAVEGTHPKNTVCITFRPSMPRDYQVQFYVYNGDGDRREWAQLDTLGPRPLPQVCMNCHGGSYDSTTHLAKFARFLPMDPNVVAFSDSGDTSRAAQEEAIRKINLLSTTSPLTEQQTTMLDQLYGGKLATANTKSATAWALPAWNDTDAHRQVWDLVVKPNCFTCHGAMRNAPAGDVLSIYTSFNTPGLLEAGLPAIRNQFSMPNSQATMLRLWEPGNPVSIAGKKFDTGADALLEHTGLTRETCPNLELLSNCNRGSDPDALCGNAFSGRACDRLTGQCVPDLNAARNPGEPNGVCKTDGSRGCVYPSTCVASGKPEAPGLPGFDGVCQP